MPPGSLVGGSSTLGLSSSTTAIGVASSFAVLAAGVGVLLCRCRRRKRAANKGGPTFNMSFDDSHDQESPDRDQDGGVAMVREIGSPRRSRCALNITNSARPAPPTMPPPSLRGSSELSSSRGSLNSSSRGSRGSRPPSLSRKSSSLVKEGITAIRDGKMTPRGLSGRRLKIDPEEKVAFTSITDLVE